MANFVSAGAAIGSVTPATTATRAAGQEAAASSGGFASLFGSGMRQASHMEAEAQASVMDLLRGGGTEVHDAMIATQQSELTFELALQVRNKAVAAYQQMMQMQF